MKKPARNAFKSLCSLESRLLDLEARVLDIKDHGRTRWFCANHRWYGCAGREACERCAGGIKQKLARLVGWEAENPQLRTEAAYDIAYDYLYSLLPPCRNCTCL